MTSGIITAIAMISFLAIAIWVFLLKSKEDFDEQAHMPLEDDSANSKYSSENKETLS